MARPELLEKRPNWGGGKWNATTVLLEPLDASETDRLLEALGGVEDALRERIRAAAEGNPLFVEEMLALLRESGEETITVPPTIQALLAARLDQLDSAERSVLECGAIEGRVFHRSAVQALNEGIGNVQGKLLRLVRKELVRPARPQFGGDDAYRFRHLLIRDAAYDALPKAVRAELHERFALWLAERGTELVELDEIVGYHLEQAARYRQDLGQPDVGLAERAGERLGAAGRRAMWRGDSRAGKSLLERALTLLQPTRLDVYLELNLAMVQPTLLEAAAVAQAAADRADAANDRRGEAVARTVAARHRAESGTGSVEEMEALARQALPLLQEAGDDDGLARIWFTLGKVAEFRCRFEDMAQAAEQAISHARRIGWPNLFGLPAALVLGPRPADEALQALDGLLADDPNPHRRLYRARLLGMLGRFDEAWATAEEVNARLRELTGEELSAPEALASIATLVGDHEAAARYWRIFCDRLQERGNRAALSTFAPTLGRSLCMLGRYDEAESLAERSRELGDEQDVATQMLWRQVQAVVYAQRGQQEEGEQLVREAVALAEQTDALDWQGDALCDLAEVLERAGHDQDAATVLEDALDRYERKKNLAMVAQVRQRMGAGKGSPPLV